MSRLLLFVCIHSNQIYHPQSHAASDGTCKSAFQYSDTGFRAPLHVPPPAADVPSGRGEGVSLSLLIINF